MLTFSIVINILLAICLLTALLLWRNRRQNTSGDLKEEEMSSLPKPRILLVGMDDETISDLSSHLGNDYELCFTNESITAPRKASLWHPALIISEYLMPGLNGGDLCHALKINPATSKTPVVILTALGHRADINYAIEAGAVDYITKPYDISVLRKIIGDSIASAEQTPEEGAAKPEAPDNELSEQDQEFLNRLNALLSAHLSDTDFVVGDICKELAMSRTSAFTRIKAVTGHSPNDYLRLYRLNEARRLLEARLWTISEVAVKVGYNDPKYFSTSFRKQFGIQPSKLLRSTQESESIKPSI